jgi:hypothetical protein
MAETDSSNRLQMSNHLRGTFHNLTAIFSPACIAHEVITLSDWTSVSIEGVTLPDAVQCWVQSLPDAYPDLGGPDNEVLFSGINRPRYVHVLGVQVLGSMLR